MSEEDSWELRRRPVRKVKKGEKSVRLAEREKEQMRRRIGRSPVSSDADSCAAPSSGNDEDVADRSVRREEKRSRHKKEAGTVLTSDSEVTVRRRVNPVLMDGRPQDVTPPVTADMPEPDRVVKPTPAEFMWRDLGNPSTEPLGPNPVGIGLATLTGNDHGKATVECDHPGTSGVVSHGVPTRPTEAEAADKSLRERNATNWYQK